VLDGVSNTAWLPYSSVRGGRVVVQAPVQRPAIRVVREHGRPVDRGAWRDQQVGATRRAAAQREREQHSKLRLLVEQ